MLNFILCNLPNTETQSLWQPSDTLSCSIGIGHVSSHLFFPIRLAHTLISTFSKGKKKSQTPTLGSRSLSDELLQLLHLSIYLLIVCLSGVHLWGGEERGIGSHVGAQEVSIWTQTDHHSLQFPGEEQRKLWGYFNRVIYWVSCLQACVFSLSVCVCVCV